MTNSVFSRLFKGTIAIGIARLSLIIFGLFTVAIAVRYIPPNEYGAYVLLQVILTFLIEFTSLGLSLALPQSLASTNEPLAKRRIINTAIWFRILIAISSGILIWALRFALNAYMGPSIWSLLLLYLPLLLVLASLERTLEWILQGLFNFNLIGVVATIGVLLNFILTLVFVVYFDYGVIGLIYAKLIPIAVQVLITGIFSKIEYRFEFNKKILSEMLVFGFPLQLQYILGFVYSRIDTLIIATFLGTTGTAYYEVARKIPDSLMQVFNAFRTVYFPLLAEQYANNQREEAIRLLNNSIRIISFITLLGALIAVTFGKDIILLLFSSQYLLVYSIFVLLMIGLSLFILENILGYSLIAIGEPDKPLVVNTFRAIISLTGNLIIVPIYGLIGAAFVRLGSNILATPLDMFFLARKKIYVKVSGYIKPLLILGVCIVIFNLFSSPSFIIKVGVIVLFIVCCLSLSVITKNDFSAIFSETKSVLNKMKIKSKIGNASP